jgi:hypothetical protein
MPAAELSTPRNEVPKKDSMHASNLGSDESSSRESSPVNQSHGLQMFQDAMYKKLVYQEEDAILMALKDRLQLYLSNGGGGPY